MTKAMPRPLPRPRAVLFDLFDTLVTAWPNDSDISPTWEDLGIPLAAWQERWFDLRDGRAHGRIADPVEALRVVAHDIDPSIPLDRIARAAERRARRFEKAMAAVEPPTVRAVERLRTAGVKLALVSNACAGEPDAWPLAPVAPYFDTAVFSCEIGHVKPDPEIYEHALGRIGVAAADAVFVGDGGSDEHRGARAVGMATVLVTRGLRDRWAHTIEDRRRHADWTVEGVPEFVEALPL